MKSSTAQMNDRKRANGLRSIQQWVVDVRGTELEESFNKELKELRERIDGLSDHYQDKLNEIKGDL
jgi:CHASE3 domain sensor protein